MNKLKNLYNNDIFYSLIVLLIMFLTMYLIKKAIVRFTSAKSIELHRRRVISNILYLSIYLVSGSTIATIWGVDLNQFTIFISSIIAVLGVAFVAQWSMLSNLTASVILFFSHPVRIGHRVRILDKDFELTGTVINITGFYFFIKTDKGENITLPNSFVIQKGIEIFENDEEMF